MDYQVSARKYRPGTFDDVIGQPHVVQTLMNAVSTKRVAHAYLFSGTRGVGKTTVARIFAKALNCAQGPTSHPCDTCENCREIALGNSVDVIEIDGASNTSVDDVREIRENVKFAPFRGHFRVYIIDEVHMLSTAAFNALLKTLEEPPEHVKFIFATTETRKIPITVLSRCQRFDLRRVDLQTLVKHLKDISQKEKVDLEEKAAYLLARMADGSVRDALSLLDQAIVLAEGSVREAHVQAMLGFADRAKVWELLDVLLQGRIDEALECAKLL